ncbi:exopolysaccharide biosynthesis polyprenyl glycosylphosphotransferase [Cellulomonas flavigena DSM 20109]|uniref:Exopolysaccharide biosynthesis polyprenyl glycosylphosphotransferase n=1 Tax=Cellulomonas flavigena (strain ATCC 482 / DSM 20109 / BCRC 11376 / JCM 18109 / NBRC 3775 / NCIMB 8073 / NRS 134) TaxID=446466 RepID=D5UK52_CELFN|nr:sugar transferase [Cellulomonas flavigena]ADG73794.1 exopolysaccharide biosynthesis polyprenyl glycosylphosphotransferase [Cellulomonas flavigena DSM 20109]
MTLAADQDAGPVDDIADRRGRAREPRRSWASSEPFVRRVTPENSDPAARALAWATVSRRYGLVAVVLDMVVALVVGAAVLAPSYGLVAAGRLACGGAAMFIAIVLVSGGYSRSSAGDGPGEFQSLLRAALTMVMILMALGYVLRVPVPRSYVLVGVPVILLVCWVARYLERRHLHRLRMQGEGVMRTVVVGDEESAEHVVRNISAAPHHGYRIDGVCVPSIEGASTVAGVPVLGAAADVVQVVVDRGADVVLVTGNYLGGDALRRLSWALSRAGAQLVVVPDIVEVGAPRLTVRPTAGLSLLEVQVASPRPHLLMKQVLDVTLAGLGLVLLSPVIGLAALLVATTSPGGAVYRQVRVGQDGTQFVMYKLRTMYQDADERRAALLASGARDGVLFKMADDPRVTPVGKILRRFSIDELPQLVNIVKGDMALVGPRPPLLEEVEAYHDSVQRRLHVKPGLTGLWQVSGRSDLDWEESVRLDLRYVDNWSVSMDLLILWKTGRAVLGGAGAY